MDGSSLHRQRPFKVKAFGRVVGEKIEIKNVPRKCTETNNYNENNNSEERNNVIKKKESEIFAIGAADSRKMLTCFCTSYNKILHIYIHVDI